MAVPGQGFGNAPVVPFTDQHLSPYASLPELRSMQETAERELEQTRKRGADIERWLSVLRAALSVHPDNAVNASDVETFNNRY